MNPTSRSRCHFLVAASCLLLARARMRARPLREDEDESDDDRRENGGGEIAADLQAAMIMRLVEEVSERCAEWPRQNKRRPKQQRVRDRRPEISSGDDRQSGGEDDRAALIASPFVSAIQSPSAVPSVCENRIATQ